MTRRSPEEAAGAVVRDVRSGSIASKLGLVPGDRVLAIGGCRLQDYIDYRFLTAEELVELRAARPDGTEAVFKIEKEPDEDLGLAFTEDIFGGPGRIKACRNRCLFCFVDRLPVGLRPALYFKDDDYRLSFLHGNFVTLTNLSGDDIARILAQRLSPLYVSVHATEPELRAALVGNARAGRIVDQLADLVRGGITVHAQVVVCPGLNDGPHLAHTLADLTRFRPGVASVGVVPVGLTRFGPSGSPVRPATSAESAETLRQTLAWHDRLGGFAYPADELILSQGLEVPAASFYGEFPQLQNGIGLTRVFLDDLDRLQRRARRARRGKWAVDRKGGFLAVTGSLARPLVEAALRVVSDLTGLTGEAITVTNRFLGPAVTVAGLLSGADIASAVLTHDLRGGLRATGRTGKVSATTAGPILVPTAALRAGSDEFLDGLTLAGLEGGTGRPCVEAGWLPGHMVTALERWLEERNGRD